MSEPIEKSDRGTGEVATLPGTFALTDLGNAERLVARYRDRIRYCAQRRKWLLWEGSRWRWDDTAAIERMAKATARKIYDEAGACSNDEQRSQIAKHARATESGKRLRDMVALAQSEAGVPVLLADLDADAWQLNCSNGTLDLRTGELLPHSRDDLITRSTAINYVAGKSSELWTRVLHDATGGDGALAAYLQRVVGYSLIGDPLERALFFLFGPPGTAKSTLVVAFHAALGEYVHSASFETWLVQSSTGGNRGDLVRLAGSRLVTSVEVRQGARFDEALVKAVTGGDEIVAAAKYEAEVSFRPSFTLILAANDAPSAREDDAGLWARMRRIPLTAVIAPERQDPSIKAKLREPEHAEAVLAWAVAGCLAYQRDGLGSCPAVEQSTSEYRAELDHFSEFLGDCCIFEQGASLTRKELRVKYEDWAQEVGRRSLLSAKDIAAKLRARGCAEKHVRGAPTWVGIRIRLPLDGGSK
ncbi:MAG TPA: phage/plasmid primase, P4 family [Polyangiaceae bacterium]|nr:phage/plasmid primase, P4 family [Polyangiaceae bacterium]